MLPQALCAPQQSSPPASPVRCGSTAHRPDPPAHQPGHARWPIIQQKQQRPDRQLPQPRGRQHRFTQPGRRIGQPAMRRQNRAVISGRRKPAAAQPLCALISAIPPGLLRTQILPSVHPALPAIAGRVDVHSLPSHSCLKAGLSICVQGRSLTAFFAADPKCLRNTIRAGVPGCAVFRSVSRVNRNGLGAAA